MPELINYAGRQKPTQGWTGSGAPVSEVEVSLTKRGRLQQSRIALSEQVIRWISNMFEISANVIRRSKFAYK